MKEKIVCKPNVFSECVYPSQTGKCLVIMPFKNVELEEKRLQDVYNEHIKKIVEECNLVCERADNDDVLAGKARMEQIWQMICAADIIIGEFSIANINVTYEMGIAHTLGKPMIGIVQEGKKLYFDYQHLGFVVYEDTAPGRRKLERDLKKQIEGYKKEIKPDNQYPQEYLAVAAGLSAEELKKAQRELTAAKVNAEEFKGALEKQIAAFASAERQHNQNAASLEQKLASAEEEILSLKKREQALQDTINFFEKKELQAEENQQPATPALPRSQFVNGEWTNLYTFGKLDWLVLDERIVDGKRQALLLSKDLIGEKDKDTKPYHEKYKAIKWETCTLRDWLNGKGAYAGKGFYDSFGKEDRPRIALTRDLKNPANTWGRTKGKPFNTPGGNPTDDYIFPLSVPEVLKYFPGLQLNKDNDGDEWYYKSDERLVAKFNGNESGSWWWLRSPGNYLGRAAGVDSDGCVDLYGGLVYDGAGGVRPALWLNL